MLHLKVAYNIYAVHGDFLGCCHLFNNQNDLDQELLESCPSILDIDFESMEMSN